jgi:hypothetical protein
MSASARAVEIGVSAGGAPKRPAEALALTGTR